jgi:hypothetical protein
MNTIVMYPDVVSARGHQQRAEFSRSPGSNSVEPMTSNGKGAGKQAPGASRKTGGPRSCYKRNGAPKAAFATAKLAERAIPATSTGLRPYACANHGWHLGH